MFDGTCQIRRVVINQDGRIILDLKAEDGTFNWKWFVAKPEQTREILSIALVAITSTKRVYCKIEDPTPDWAEVQTFGIFAPGL
jgi:hypothetical protein